MKRRSRGTYTDFGAAYLGRMYEIEPRWFTHICGLIIGIFLFCRGFPSELTFLLGFFIIQQNVLGLQEDYKKGNPATRPD